MFIRNRSSAYVIQLVLMFLTNVESNILFDSLARSAKFLSKRVEQFLDVSRSIAPPLCSLRTDQLIQHYGYIAEEHNILTQDGYNLTVFRCNSKQNTPNQDDSDGKKKVVILQHGLLASSDDFCGNIPEQALPYVLADASYDVWIPNSRGNTYSRKHVYRDPDNPFSGFWTFSWLEMGTYDHPAVIDYVLEKTNNSKVFYVGHSQGTTSLMVLLSEKPEYNEKIHAAALLAPVGYMNHSDWTLHTLNYARPYLDWFQSTEFLPRIQNSFVGNIPAAFCNMDMSRFCDNLLNLMFGPSNSQRNDTMLPSFICHSPSGASINQMFHFGMEMQHGYFGKYMRNSEIPADFELWRITTPLSLHYSHFDPFVSPIDVKRLISQLKSVAYVQVIDKKEFNHIDFIWGIDSAKLIYSKILKFFEAYH